LEKYKLNKYKPSLKEALQEFNYGYMMTAILAIFFLIIGWMTLYGTNTELSGNATTFADQVVQLFTTHIGDWAYIFIAVSAFATMFSTCMTAHDAISRVSVDIIGLLTPKHKDFSGRKYYASGVVLLALVNFIVITAFGANMGTLVALATFVSFVLAPIVGYMNLKNVMSHDLPKSFHPGKGLQVLTFAGIIFLSLFAVYYCWMVLF
jgi:Mn2+/Fe2+ NRAMP family transporter